MLIVFIDFHLYFFPKVLKPAIRYWIFSKCRLTAHVFRNPNSIHKVLSERIPYGRSDSVFFRLLIHINFVGVNQLKNLLSKRWIRFISSVLIKRTVLDSVYDLQSEDGFVAFNLLSQRFSKSKTRPKKKVSTNQRIFDESNHFFIIAMINFYQFNMQSIKEIKLYTQLLCT
jgi:hypothetical protein